MLINNNGKNWLMEQNYRPIRVYERYLMVFIASK